MRWKNVFVWSILTTVDCIQAGEALFMRCMEDIRQPERQLPCSSYNHNTRTTPRTLVKGHYKCTLKLE